MGRKVPETTAAAKEPEKKEESTKEEAAVEDTPIVKELKIIDDKYLELEREYEKKMHALQREYTEKQKPLLDQRAEALKKPAEGSAGDAGTPACPGFWAQAMKNHPAFEDSIEEWDIPVLEYLSDITKADLKEDDGHAGFKLTFHFVENRFITNTTLTKEYHTEEDSPYTGELSVKKIVCSPIEWKAGQDVTVEKKQKKVKGGGAKKAKQKGKETEEPRSSFFRSFFRNLEDGQPLPDDMDPEEMEMLMQGDDDEEQLLEMLMQNDHEMGCAFKDNIIPFAVRWYTGEAAPDVDDDDEDGEEEDVFDSDEDEDSSEDEPSPKKNAKGKKGGKPSPNVKPSADPKQEECKQQ